MKVIVIGATGRVGRLVCSDLVDSGHEVVASSRGAGAIPPSEHVEGLVLDLHSPLSAIVRVFEATGADAVIFTAGSRGEDIMQVDALGAIKTIEAAKKAGIERYIMLGAMYAADMTRWEEPGPKMAIRALPDYYVAKFVADDHLLHSGLDYTIIEPGSLVDEEGTGKIQVGPTRPGQIPIPDVAGALAACVDLPGTVGRVYDMVGGPTPIGQALTE